MSEAISSILAMGDFSLMLALIHLSISPLVAFLGAASSKTGRRSPMMKGCVGSAEEDLILRLSASEGEAWK